MRLRRQQQFFVEGTSLEEQLWNLNASMQTPIHIALSNNLAPSRPTELEPQLERNQARHIHWMIKCEDPGKATESVVYQIKEKVICNANLLRMSKIVEQLE